MHGINFFVIFDDKNQTKRMINLKTLSGVENRILNTDQPDGSTTASIFEKRFGSWLFVKTISLKSDNVVD